MVTLFLFAFSILTNAQSPGIVKRLVSYYDESQPEADKSKYVYNRVGDFPIVQLKKTEIKRNLVRSSSVRIAPPPKHIMNRDIRAAILRSNSFQHGANVPKLVPTKMRVNDDAHQIIRHDHHEPLPISDGAQTAKSVLDALEKNCRKRINNEELTLDRNKRICATTAQPEVVDGPQSRDFIPIHNSAKRGREETSPPTKGDSPNSQQRKKSRLKNNALLSSLSSSQYILKRNLDVTPSVSLPTVQTITRDLPKATIATQTAIESLEKPTEMETSISEPKEPEKRLHLFNKKIDSTTSVRKRILDDDDDEEFKINFVKPRENTRTLENHQMRQAEQQKLSIMLSGLSDGFKSPTREVPAKDAVDAIVPPQATISFSTSTTTSTASPISTPASTNNPLLSLTSQSSSLLPTIKTTGSTDKPAVATSEASEKPPATSEAAKPMPNFQFGVTSSASTLSVSAAVTSTTSSATGRVSPLALFSSPGESKPATTAIIDPNKSLISFTPIAKTVVSEAPVVVSSTTAPTVTTNSAPSFGITSSGFTLGDGKDAPKLPGGFNFGSNTTSAGISSPAGSFLGALNSSLTGLSSFPSAENLEKANAFIQKPQTTTASGIGFSFNATPKTSPQVTTAAPNLIGFSFGSSVNTMAGSAVPAQPPSATPSTFSFGSNTGFGQLAVTTASTGFPSNPTPSFSASTNSSFAPTTTSSGFAPTTTSSGFAPTVISTFGSFGQKTEAQPSPGMFSFGQNAAATPASAPKADATFSFGAATQPAAQPLGGFSFGQNAETPAPAAASSSIFGRLGDKPQEPAKPAFSFGGNTPAPSIGFGTSSNTPAQPVAAPSVFGNASNNAQPSQPAATSPFNNNSSSNNVFGSTQSSAQNGFGNNAAKPSAGMFAFGGTNSQPQQQPAQPSSGGMFSFGGNSTPSNNNNVSTSSVFGGISSQNVSASFTFKPSTGTVTNNSAPSVFGQNQNSSSAAPPAYQFGNSQSSTTASASFNFGGSSASSSQSTNGFNFAPQTAPVTGSAFNFQAQQPSLTPQPSSSGGLFNIGTGGNAQRRPIRQATRRMK